ncbi:O-antigen ligase family protein [Patescibacteria group bacterium]|nr:O-antigen ligase family protein [Patescibacteria group bacterium]
MTILESIKDILKKPYLMFYSILLFFTPLIFVSNTNELFEFPKMYFIYLLGIFIIFFFVSDYLINLFEIKTPHPLVLALLTLFLISTLLSSHLYTSFFGYYSRFNDSLLSNLVFFGLYFVGINKLNKDDYEKILKITLFTILPISFLGLSQYFNGTVRAFSSIGQPNWLAQYLAMLLPLVVYFLLTEESGRYKVWFAVYVFGFYCLWVSYSTSGIFSFIVAVILVLIKMWKTENKVKDIKGRVIMFSAISIFISFSNLGIFKDKISDVFVDLKKQTFILKKVYAQGVENTLSDPGFIRIELWKSSLDLIFSNSKVFFFGSGPETFPYAFQPFRSRELNYSSEWDFVFNKPHNYYLEMWSESGIFFLIIFVVLMFKLIKKSPGYLAPSFVAFGISNLFGWPVVSTSLLFWFFLCISDEYIRQGFIDKKSKSKKKKVITIVKDKKYIYLVPVWLVYFIFVYKISEVYFADVHFRKSQDLAGESQVDQAINFADKAIQINPYEPNYYRGRAKIRTVYLVSSENTEEIKSLILDDLKKAEDLNPYNLVTLRNSIPIYYFLGVRDVSIAPGEGNIDEKYISQASEFFDMVKGEYWNDVGVVLAVARYEKRLGLNESYEKSLFRIEELRPDLLEWSDLLR